MRSPDFLHDGIVIPRIVDSHAKENDDPLLLPRFISGIAIISTSSRDRSRFFSKPTFSSNHSNIPLT